MLGDKDAIATREGDVHVAGDLRLAWLKDPDGNLLALMNQ